MTILHLELPAELYERLAREAEGVGDTVQIVAQRLLEERLGWISVSSEREQVSQVLRTAGLLAELGPEMRERARQSTARLEDVQAALDASEGQSLSDTIIEMRGPKE